MNKTLIVVLLTLGVISLCAGLFEVYKIEYKGHEYLVNNQGGIIEVK